MLIKFVPPETLARFGGAERFAEAIDRSLDRLADVIGDPATFRTLLFGEAGAMLDAAGQIGHSEGDRDPTARGL